MKKLLLPALLLLCLAACARSPETAPADPPTPVPTVDPSPLQATWLKVDEAHRFWVELNETDEPSPITEAPIHNGSTYTGLRVDIYEGQEDARPIQSFLTGYNCRRASLQFSLSDWDLDGHIDLAFTNAVIGSRYHGMDFYLWDPEAQAFIPDPYGLCELNYPELYPEEQVITSLWPITGGSETYRHYRYEAGKLTLTRECQKLLDPESGVYSFSVKEPADGGLQTVFQETRDQDDTSLGEYTLWRDQFDYPPTLWGFPIDYTHDAFEVPTGGRLGTVLVTVEIENGDAEEYQFSVWTKDDLDTPLQTMTAESWGIFHSGGVEDANFDGYMDFGYLYFRGNQPCYSHYWIWNEDAGLFVAEPEFDQISCPQFDAETGIISGYSRDGFAGAAGTTTFHQWIDEKLVCIRRIRTYPYGGDTLNEIRLTVEEPVDGVLTEIYRHETDVGTAFDEARKWEDLDYHGE